MHGFLRTYGHLDPRTKTGWNMGTTPQQLAASFVNFGTISGVLVAGRLGKYISRRHGLWLACVLSILGSGLQLKSSHVAGLYARRIIIGTSNGMFMTFANAYTTECAPSKLKRSLLTFYGVCVCFGGLLGAVTNKLTAQIHTPWAYKIPLTCHMMIPCLLVLLITFIPGSPRWLLAHNRPDEARRSLNMLRGRTLAMDTLDEEFSETRNSVESEKKLHRERRYRDIFKGSDRRRTLLCFAVLLSNSLSGIWLMLSYGTVVFQLAEVHDPFQASVYSNLANFTGMLVGLYLSLKMRRQTMITAGHFISGLCMLGIGVLAAVELETESASKAIAALIIGHGFTYYASSFAVSSKICNDIVSQELRDLTVSVGSLLNYAASCKWHYFHVLKPSRLLTPL